MPAADRSDQFAAFGVRLLPEQGRSIDYDSIRFRYGAFRIDITDRVRNCFDFTGDILVSGEMLPKGKHKLRIEVADDDAAVSQLTVSFRVL